MLEGKKIKVHRKVRPETKEGRILTVNVYNTVYKALASHLVTLLFLLSLPFLRAKKDIKKMVKVTRMITTPFDRWEIEAIITGVKRGEYPKGRSERRLSGSGGR
jgi:hypothetical protein